MTTERVRGQLRQRGLQQKNILENFPGMCLLFSIKTEKRQRKKKMRRREGGKKERREREGRSKDLKSIKIATHLEFSVDLNSKRKPEATFKRGETNYRFREKLNGTSSL